MGAPSSKPSQNIELHIQRTQYRLSSHKNIQMWGGENRWIQTCILVYYFYIGISLTHWFRPSPSVQQTISTLSSLPV